MGKPRVLITGNKGKVGTALTRAFSDAWEIHGIDVDSGVDISDWGSLDQAFSDIGDVDYVVHLAAIASSRASWDDVLRHNIVGTRNVFERAKEAGVQKVLFASSWHVVGGYHMHGEGALPMIRTSDPVRPDGDYATSKAFGETIARQYYDQFGLRSVSLRIGNVEANDRPRDEHAERIWLSHRDLVQLVEKGLMSGSDFGIYFATSANKERFLDLSSAEKELGYVPQDDASSL